jgi:hypothetical protein
MRGITHSTLLTLLFWAAVCLIGLYILFQMSCRMGTLSVGC